MTINKNISTFNFNTGIISRIKYIVIHYTANNGDTAYSNTNYFLSYRGASAHYFVDENSIWQSVEDKNIAWHCGATTYKHASCRNTNSLGIELCSRISNGAYYFKDETVANAVELTKYLMDKYNVPVENVIRHYDVMGKVCPAPFVNDTSQWQGFLSRLEDTEVVESIQIQLNGITKTVQAIKKDGYNYVMLRDLADSKIAIDYDSSKNLPTVSVDAVKNLEIELNGTTKTVEAINSDGFNYVKLRDLADDKITIGYDNSKALPVVEVK